MKSKEGLKLWFGLHSREEMKREGKRKRQRRKAVIRQGLLLVTRKEWESLEI